MAVVARAGAGPLPAAQLAEVLAALLAAPPAGLLAELTGQLSGHLPEASNRLHWRLGIVHSAALVSPITRAAMCLLYPCLMWATPLQKFLVVDQYKLHARHLGLDYTGPVYQELNIQSVLDNLLSITCVKTIRSQVPAWI